MDPNQSVADDSGPSLKDPELVTKLVEELKSQGIFDQIRSDCLAEVDTKPAYQNLRQRVEGSVERYLNRQQNNFKPNANSKIQMRNMLRKHIQDSNYLGSGTQGIVDQVVGPKIMTTIEPEMEAIMYKMFGIEKPDSNDEDEDAQNGAATEKLSNISSSDAEMPSAAESEHEEGSTKNKEDHETDASSPGPGLRGDISPLTPDRKSDEVEAPRGNVSPLTPPPPGTAPLTPPPPGTGEPVDLPPRTPSPRTPPLPPPMRSEVMEQQVVEEEIIAQDSMSPVSDGDLADISPPKGSPETPDDSGMPSPPQAPQLPPLPSGSSTETPPLPAPPPPPPPPKISRINRPPSPLTSPIESSSSADESEQKRQVSASDISDAELPATASSGKESSDDLEELEKAKAALEAQLAAANISDEASTSEGEPMAEQKTEAENSSSAKEEDEEKSSSQDDHEQAKRKPSKSSEDEDGDGSNDPNPNVGHAPQPDSTTGSVETKSTDDKAGSSKESSSSKERRSSKDQEKSHRHRDHHDRHHHGHGHHHKKSHKKDRERDGERERDRDGDRERDRDRERSKSKSDKSDKERSDHHHHHHHKSHGDKYKDKHGNGSSSSNSKDKNSKSKYERQSSKVEEIEAKIKEKSIKSFKSDKLNSFDMFAPKTPKPKLVMPKPVESQKPITPSTPISNSPSVSSSLPKSPDTVKPKTPKMTFLQKYDLLKKQQKEKDKAEKAAKAAATTPKVEKKDSFIVHSESPRSVKSYPGFPLTVTHVDKEKQHELEMLETKRLLAERREKLKLEEKQKKEMKKKHNKNRNSSGSSPTKETKEISSASDKDDVKRYETKRGDDDSGSDIEYQRPLKVDKKRRRVSSSDEELGVVEVKGEKPIISTRKEKQKKKADEILNDPDPDFSANHGWTSDELNTIDVTKNEALKKYLAMAQADISSVEVPPVTDAELEDIEEHIYFEAGNDYPEGNAKLVEVLRKIGKDAGVKRAPKLVRKCPPEIQVKLDHFGFKRHQVEIITDPSKIRKKRIYTEVEYCHKLGKPPMKKSRVVFIEDPTPNAPETIPEPEIDDIEAQLAKMDSQDSSEEESIFAEKKIISEWSDDEPFYGFESNNDNSKKNSKPSGSYFSLDLDLYESVKDEEAIPESNGLKVYFSNAMLTHCKKRLSKDKEAMAELNKIRGMKPSQIKALQKNKPAVKEEVNDAVEEVKGPGDCPMPPSPESNTPSDDSNEEKGSVSPIIGSTNIDSVEKMATPQRRQARRTK